MGFLEFAAAFVAKSKPDGYTLLYGAVSGLADTSTIRTRPRASTCDRRWAARAPLRLWVAIASGQPRMIQVGAYGERETARRIADQLQAAGIRDVDVDGVRVGVNLLWRVRVGPVPHDALEDVLARIQGLGLPSPRVFSE